MEDFKNYLQQQDKSPVTIKRIRKTSQSFLYRGTATKDTINVQKKDILNYLSYLKHHKNHQAVSSNHGLIALRHYFDCLVGQGIICLNPTALIKLRGIKNGVCITSTL
ncbi:MAG: site-specific integrase [Alistipes shahii]